METQSQLNFESTLWRYTSKIESDIFSRNCTLNPIPPPPTHTHITTGWGGGITFHLRLFRPSAFGETAKSDCWKFWKKLRRKKWIFFRGWLVVHGLSTPPCCYFRKHKCRLCSIPTRAVSCDSPGKWIREQHVGSKSENENCIQLQFGLVISHIHILDVVYIICILYFKV